MIRGAKFQRKMTLERSTLSEANRTVEAAISSEAPVKRFGYTEILSHDPAHVDLTRAADGIPLLWNHRGDLNDFLGRARNIRIDKDKLRATVNFSDSDSGNRVMAEVAAGNLSEMSIGYEISDFTEDTDSRTITVTRWAPFEASFTPTPADPTVGAGRSLTNEDQTMGDNSNVVDIEEAARKKGTELERARVASIEKLFAPYLGKEIAGVEALRTASVQGTETADQVSRKLLDVIGEANAGAVGTAGRAESNGEDEKEKFVRAAGLEIGSRTDLLSKEEKTEALKSEYRGYSMVELARRCLDLSGVNTSGMSRDAIIKGALTLNPNRAVGVDSWRMQRAGGGFITNSTVDFPAILEDTLNKAALAGFVEANTTWRMIARVGSLPDFKQGTRAGLGALPALPVVVEGGEYKYTTTNDVKELIQLATYGSLFSITRQALINDDLEFFNQARMQGAAADRTVNQRVYSVLTTNAAMNEDATALFHANHSNLEAASVGAPTVALLNLADTAMGTQTDPSSNADALNLELSRLIVPRALKNTALVLVAAEKDPAVASGVQPNPFANNLQVVADAVLDSDSAAAWYCSSDPNSTDALEAAFLDGVDAPFMESEAGWAVDGTDMKVRIDVAAIARSFRGLYKNNGV